MITLISQNARLCVTIVIKTIFLFRSAFDFEQLFVIDIISMQYKQNWHLFKNGKKVLLTM